MRHLALVALLAGCDPPSPSPAPAPSPAPSPAPAPAPADTLCAEINHARERASAHEPFGGAPAAYHPDRVWPITFTLDDTLSSSARLEAERIAQTGRPRGGLVPGGMRHRPLYVASVNTNAYEIAFNEVPGDRDPQNTRYALAPDSGTARRWLLYHDPGAHGPRLTRIGCGRALARDGSTWWVVRLGP